MEIKLVADYHCVPEMSEPHTRYMERFDPETTVALFEAIDSSHGESARLYSTGEISFKTFWNRLDLRNHWGPAESYRGPLEYAGRAGMEVCSLDCDIQTRQMIASGFRDLADKLIRCGWNVENSMLYDVWTGELGLAREKIFCGSINDARYEDHQFSNKKTALVFTGKSHFNPLMFDLYRYHSESVQVAQLFEPKEEELFAAKEQTIALAEGNRIKILEKEGAVPLVPAVFRAFVEVANAREKASKK